MRVKHAGFTLLETLVVLALLSSTWVITTVRFPTRQRQLNDEKAFWQRLDSLWQHSILLTSTTGHRRVVNFLAASREVTFGDHDGELSPPPTDRLKLPATMMIKKDKQIIIQRNGHPQLAVVLFKSSLTPGENQKFSALMGWGAYRVAKVKDAAGFYST